jgi:hypothetical protein
MVRLLDYMRGALDPEVESAFEEELFSGAFAAEDVEWLAAFIASVRRASLRGSLTVIVDAAHVVRMRAAGLRVRETDARDGVVEMDVSKSNELIVVRYPVPLEGVTRLDVEMRTNEGDLLKRLKDLTLPRDRSELLFCCERDVAAQSKRAFGSITARFLSVEHPRDRELGSFVLRYVGDASP